MGKHSYKNGKFFYGDKEQTPEMLIDRVNKLEVQSAIFCGDVPITVEGVNLNPLEKNDG
jgi:hypothetical protein